MRMSKRERTQKEIIEAAKTIIHEKGHEAITVRYLAEVTGYSYTNLYYYFKDLNAFLWTLRLHMIEEMMVELTGISYSAENPVDEILGAFHSYVNYFFEHPNVFRFFYFCPIIQPEGDDSNQKLDQRFHQIWKDSFYKLIQDGVILSKDLEVAAKTIIYALQGMILLSFSSNGSTGKEDTAREVAKLVKYILKTDR